MSDQLFTNQTGMFASDNVAGVHPKIMDAVARYSSGSAMPYGDDPLTKRVEAQLADLFEHECAVFLVGTGTAANALALSALCPPHGAVYCHEDSHVNTDECGAPELYSGGAKLVAMQGEHGKLTAEALAGRLAYAEVHGIHAVKPSAMSLTNATEAGTVYQPEEITAVAEVCHQHGLHLHMDGARFANAVAHLGVSPAALTWQAGVDVLTLGATKNGAFAAEAIIFFKPEQAKAFGYRRKRGGQLWSKHRFLAAQFEAYLADDLWLDLAHHANDMAQRLATGLAELPGVTFLHPVEANELFPQLPEPMIAGLEADGLVFYRWPSPLSGLVRLVTSFATRPEEVEAFLTSARKHANDLTPT